MPNKPLTRSFPMGEKKHINKIPTKSPGNPATFLSTVVLKTDYVSRFYLFRNIYRNFLQERLGWEIFTLIWRIAGEQPFTARSSRCAQNYRIGYGSNFSIKDYRTGPFSKLFDHNNFELDSMWFFFVCFFFDLPQNSNSPNFPVKVSQKRGSEIIASL